MTGRRAAVGLSLICTLVFCALGAPSALAKGTTVFTCVKNGGEEDFKDAHCDENVGVKKGTFGHVAIAAGKSTPIEITNEKTKGPTTESTPAILTSTFMGVAIELECEKVSGGGFIENQAGPPMKAISVVLVSYQNCKVPKPKGKGAETCDVVEPIEVEVNAETRVINESPEEMGVELTPTVSETFTELSLVDGPGGKCPIKGTYPIRGSAIATAQGAANGGGATAHVLPNAAMSPLFWGGGGVPARLAQVVTVKVASGDPVTLTTTAN